METDQHHARGNRPQAAHAEAEDGDLMVPSDAGSPSREQEAEEVDEWQPGSEEASDASSQQSEKPVGEQQQEEGAPEQSVFLVKLKSFFQSRGKEFWVPRFNHVNLDVAKLHHLVSQHGGYDKVCSGKLWAKVGRHFNPPKTMTNLSYNIKRMYLKSGLLAYERSLQGVEEPLPMAGRTRRQPKVAGAAQVGATRKCATHLTLSPTARQKRVCHEQQAQAGRRRRKRRTRNAEQEEPREQRQGGENDEGGQAEMQLNAATAPAAAAVAEQPVSEDGLELEEALADGRGMRRAGSPTSQAHASPAGQASIRSDNSEPPQAKSRRSAGSRSPLARPQPPSARLDKASAPAPEQPGSKQGGGPMPLPPAAGEVANGGLLPAQPGTAPKEVAARPARRKRMPDQYGDYSRPRTRGLVAGKAAEKEAWTEAQDVGLGGAGLMGHRVRLWDPLSQTHRVGRVAAYHVPTGKHVVECDDGQEHVADLGHGKGSWQLRWDDMEDVVAAQQLAALAAGEGRPVAPASGRVVGVDGAADGAGQQEGGRGVLDVAVLHTLKAAAEEVPACADAGAFFTEMAAAARPQRAITPPAHVPAVLPLPNDGTTPSLPPAGPSAAADLAAAAGPAAAAVELGAGVVIDATTSIVLMRQAASLVRGMHEELQRGRAQVAQLGAGLAIALDRQAAAEAGCRSAQASAQEARSLLQLVLQANGGQQAQQAPVQGQAQQSPALATTGIAAVTSPRHPPAQPATSLLMAHWQPRQQLLPSATLPRRQQQAAAQQPGSPSQLQQAQRQQPTMPFPCPRHPPRQLPPCRPLAPVAQAPAPLAVPFGAAAPALPAPAAASAPAPACASAPIWRSVPAAGSIWLPGTTYPSATQPLAASPSMTHAQQPFSSSGALPGWQANGTWPPQQQMQDRLLASCRAAQIQQQQPAQLPHMLPFGVGMPPDLEANHLRPGSPSGGSPN